VPEDFRNRKIHRCWRLAEGWKPRERKPRELGADASGESSADNGESNPDTLQP
jgi:hypothetical protein